MDTNFKLKILVLISMLVMISSLFFFGLQNIENNSSKNKLILSDSEIPGEWNVTTEQNIDLVVYKSPQGVFLTDYRQFNNSSQAYDDIEKLKNNVKNTKNVKIKKENILSGFNNSLVIQRQVGNKTKLEYFFTVNNNVATVSMDNTINNSTRKKIINNYQKLLK